ncbi:cancer-related nucleoside-triphosphatase-like isoform X2 [Halichondria panicea]|uniref:cancer-related nucleoside-triphosphatase-like isoform X2 n=1 Tax=Halichondria panicea TaxID=6063 RepID=UPI00312B763B
MAEHKESEDLSTSASAVSSVASLPPIPKRHALITGPPGIGKSTIVRAVCQRLKEEIGSTVGVRGIFRVEVRGAGDVFSGWCGPHIGFDAVTLDGKKRGTLARIGTALESRKLCPVNPGTIDDLPLFGVIFSDRYSIDLASFEEVSRHALRLLDDDDEMVYAVDGLAKMELYSRIFMDRVEHLFEMCIRRNISMVVVISEVEVQQKSHRVVYELLGRSDCKLFEANEGNRDALVTIVTEFIKTGRA